LSHKHGIKILVARAESIPQLDPYKRADGFLNPFKHPNSSTGSAGMLLIF